MTIRVDLRKRDPTLPELPRLNCDIQNRIYAHKRHTGRATRENENEEITFNGSSFSSSKQLAARFNQQFNTSKLGRNTYSGETRLVTRETKKKSLEMTQTFTADQWGWQSRAVGLVKLWTNSTSSTWSISDLERSNTSPPSSSSHSRMSDSGDMEVFIDHPNTETWQGHLPRNFVSAYLASLPSHESTGVSASAH